jgi:glycosyltransferase involved in cell wall biosynthesis
MTYPYGVSFIVPAFNEGKNLEACIDAIKHEMRRNRNIKSEIIVVNNNSTDNTREVAEAAGAIVIDESEKGVVYARNAGYKKAKYELLANIDADNIIPEGWMKQARLAMKDSKVVAISGPLKYYDVPNYVNAGSKLFYLIAGICHYVVGPSVQGGNYVIRKSVLDKMGGYDTSFKFYGEDTRTAVLASQHGKVKMVSKLWIHASPRRIKQQGLTNTIYSYTSNYFSVSLFGKQTTNKYIDWR